MLDLDEQIEAVHVIGPDNSAKTYGLAKERYKWASVSKLLAMHVFADAIVSGFISLDDQIDHPNIDNSVTLADLLSHSSGIKPELESPIEPCTKRIYSNIAFDIAEQHLIKKLGPGFEGQSVGSLFNDGFKHDLNSSIEFSGSCAFTANGTFDDLILFLNEIRNPKLIDPSIFSLLTSPHNDGLPGILPGWGHQENNTWGIGYEIKGNKDPHWMGSLASEKSYGHFGMAGTFIFHDPVNNISVALQSAKDFGPWAKHIWPPLCKEIYNLFA